LIFSEKSYIIIFYNKQGVQMLVLKGKYNVAKIMIDNIEQECISQIYGFLNL